MFGVSFVGCAFLFFFNQIICFHLVYESQKHRNVRQRHHITQKKHTCGVKFKRKQKIPENLMSEEKNDFWKKKDELENKVFRNR